jgi:hypothetical protein
MGDGMVGQFASVQLHPRDDMAKCAQYILVAIIPVLFDDLNGRA